MGVEGERWAASSPSALPVSFCRAAALTLTHGHTTQAHTHATQYNSTPRHACVGLTRWLLLLLHLARGCTCCNIHTPTPTETDSRTHRQLFSQLCLLVLVALNQLHALSIHVPGCTWESRREGVSEGGRGSAVGAHQAA